MLSFHFEKVFYLSPKELYCNRIGTTDIFDVNKEGKEATDSVLIFSVWEKY